MYYYVYRLTCTHPLSEARYYYGVRQCRCLPQEDTNYWSSSRVVGAARKTLGKQWFVKKIVSVHPTRQAALMKEIRLHHCFNVRDNPKFFNQANQTSIGFDAGPISLEARQKISAALLKNQHTKGRKRTAEERARISQAMKGQKSAQGRSVSEVTRQKISEARTGWAPFFGKRHSEATRAKISQAMKARRASDSQNESFGTKLEFSERDALSSSPLESSQAVKSGDPETSGSRDVLE
jgi:hypothetical protein